MPLAERIDEMHEAAIAESGLSDFGSNDYLAPMALAFLDLDRHKQLARESEDFWFGWGKNQLIGRMMAIQGFKDYPQYANSKIERPIIIVGMMRTGSTALHRLLSKDPANQVMEMWLANAPMPRPSLQETLKNPFYLRAEAALDDIRANNPRFNAYHPQGANEADECYIALQKTFYSPELLCYNVPEYTKWFMDCDPTWAYRFYRQMMGLIGGGNKARWVIKLPSHVFTLRAVLNVFPDAHVVWTHRELVSAAGSSANLLQYFRWMAKDFVPLEEQGREIMEIWGEGLHRGELARQEYDERQFLDVHIDQMHNDPVGLAETIYRYFDIPFSDESRAALEAHVAGDPTIGHEKSTFDLKDFGITAERTYECAGAYAARNREICERLGHRMERA